MTPVTIREAALFRQMRPSSHPTTVISSSPMMGAHQLMCGVGWVKSQCYVREAVVLRLRTWRWLSTPPAKRCVPRFLEQLHFDAVCYRSRLRMRMEAIGG